MAIILLAVFGLPVLTSPPPQIVEPIPVELATLADKTNVPPLAQKPPAKPAPPKLAPPLPPSPPLPEPPKAEAPPPPPPPPKPQPQQVAALPPPPEPAPEPLPQPMAEKKPEPPPKPQPPQPPQPSLPLPPLPQAKPQPPDQNAVEKILRSIEKSKPPPQPDQVDKVVKQFAAAASPPPPTSLDNRMTMSEIDAVRQQIERCWNVPAGAKDAKDLVVDIHVTLNPDGSVRAARIVDQARLGRDSFFRAAAESAYRAIFQCQPLHLPPDKYSLWQDMTLSFNPSQIL